MESLAGKHETLHHEAEGWDLSHLSEHQAWIPTTTCCYSLILFGDLFRLPSLQKLHKLQRDESASGQEIKGKCIPFHLCFKMKNKGLVNLEIWAIFLPSLLSLAFMCSLECIIWNLYMDIDLMEVNYLPSEATVFLKNKGLVSNFFCDCPRTQFLLVQCSLRN